MGNDTKPKPMHLLTEADAAAFLSLSKRTLRRWRHIKIGPPFYRLPGHKTGALYQQKDLIAWIESGRIEHTTE
ncbi:MAG: helix-turn-helix domain-containing protein [Thermomonas sp.]|uniref:helix-turn-helix transcriptional regulator n=1 Tax=Thermomonas sp. TaxID=1971895 RepID=UPI00261FDC8B|nr:helix-turn-helix domain-containing protein [Thermomonas sp.]MCC7097479.1 helix-turn-helix domain-containing protein [Thermomonas sp.]